MYAIIATGGKQYKVSEGDIIKVEKLAAEAGDTVTFDQVVAVSDGSLIDLSLELKRNTTVDEINNAFINNQNETLKYTCDPIVSSDIIASSCGGLVDGLLTNIVECDGKQLVKVVAWYDNEVGYTAQMLRTMKKFME